MKASDNISKENIIKYLSGDMFACDIHILDSVDSTNNYAKKLASSGAPHGSVVIAKKQTAGRGRLDRSFYSPSDAGVYLSIVLRPEFDVERILLITAAASVALCRAIDFVAHMNTEIKWVNDIYLKGKKLCGILAETNSSNIGSVDYIILGIGINVTNNAFPPDIKDVATSLLMNTDIQIDTNLLIAQVLNEFEKVYADICADNIKGIMDEYKKRSCVIGKKVKAICAGKEREVFVCDIDDFGALVVKNEEGQYEKISSGEISIRFL